MGAANNNTLSDPEASAANAGPGQKPRSPQPMPKTIAADNQGCINFCFARQREPFRKKRTGSSGVQIRTSLW